MLLLKYEDMKKVRETQLTNRSSSMFVIMTSGSAREER